MNDFEPKFKIGDIVITKPEIFVIMRYIKIPPKLARIYKILAIIKDTYAKERIVDERYEAGYANEYYVKDLENDISKNILQGDICLFSERKDELIEYYENKLQFIKKLK